MKSTRLLAVTNFLVIIATIFVNYYVNSRPINGNTIKTLSDTYANLFTPASYAFSIWGLIFLMLVAHGIYQLICAFSARKDEFINQIGGWLMLANIGNASWTYIWLLEQTGLSVIVMLVILISLIMIILRTNMERWDAPVPLIAFVWWPICLYSGWIAVATIANIAGYLAKLEWSPLFSETTWTIIMMAVVVVLNLLMIATRNMREFAMVGVWALVAIAVRHWDQIAAIQYTAVVGAAILFIAASAHAYKNRATSPINKIFNS